MVTGIFGIPGCGKSTYLSMLAVKELKRIQKGKSSFKHVLANFPVQGCEMIDVFQLGRYDIQDCLILLDEITLDVDSRDYKAFSQSLKNFFILHRHANCSVVWFAQDSSRVDKTIRNVTFDLWYLYKPILPFFNNFSVCKRIFRQLNINEYTSELTLGYRFAKFLEILFTPCKKLCWRPRYYKYFDSFDLLQLDGLPPFQYEKWQTAGADRAAVKK